MTFPVSRIEVWIYYQYSEWQRGEIALVEHDLSRAELAVQFLMKKKSSSSD